MKLVTMSMIDYTDILIRPVPLALFRFHHVCLVVWMFVCLDVFPFVFQYTNPWHFLHCNGGTIQARSTGFYRMVYLAHDFLTKLQYHVQRVLSIRGLCKVHWPPSTFACKCLTYIVYLYIHSTLTRKISPKSVENFNRTHG